MFGVVLIILTSGCSSFGKLRLNFSVSDDSNPDKSNQSLPLIVNCYQLKNSDSFNMADFETLWKNPDKYLNDDKISNFEVNIIPNQDQVKIISLSSNAKYLACVALFNRPEEKWKDVVRLENKLFSKKINLLIKGNSINII